MAYATVRAISAPELVHLAAKGQWSKLYLAMFQPSSIYTARLASVPSSTDRVLQVSFNTGSGTLADVLPDMTMYVGSTAGAYDLGVARIRKAPIAGTFYIGEESDITWQANCYLTVVNEFDLWAKHIVTVDDETFYMDGDITYTDQNSVLNPVPIMGGHRVLKLTGASVSTVFDFSNSYCLGSSITGYSVSCPTASSVTNGSTSAPTIAFNTAGWHMVVLTVTAANGKTSVGVRYVYVYSSAAMSPSVSQLSGCSCDYDTGGWNFTVTMHDDIGDIPERTLCILFSEDIYDGTSISMGQVAGCENVICTGKIAGETLVIDPELSEVSFEVQGMHYWLSHVYAFPTGVILTTSTPTNWAEMQSPTVDKVLFRLFYWGSTASKIMDIYLTGDTKLATELTSPASNLWAQMQEIAFATLQARSGVDRHGRMFVETEPQIVPVASRTWPTVMTIEKKHWHDNVRMQRVVVTPTGMVNSSGVVVAADGTGDALFSLAPGHVFMHYGSPEIVDRLLLSTQVLSNQLAGLTLNWKNNPYPNTEMKLSSNNRMIDCFPRQRLYWQVVDADNPRGVAFSSYFVPRRIEHSHDPDTGFLETAIAIEMESVEGVYVNGDIPGQGADPSQPPEPPPFPPLPDFPVIVPGDVPTGGASIVIVHDNGAGFLYSSNFDSGSPTWQSFNAGLTSGQYQSANRLIITPGGVCYCAYAGGTFTNTSGSGFIARAPSIGGTWTVLYSNANLSSGGGRWGILGMGGNTTVPDSVGAIIENANDGESVKFYTLSGGTGTAGGAVVGPGYFYGIGLSYGFGKWMITTYDTIKLSTNGASWSSAPAAAGGVGFSHARAGSTGTTFMPREFNIDLCIGTNNATTLTNIDSDYKVAFDGGFPQEPIYFDCSLDGQYCMSRWNGKGRSSDGGYTWTAIPNLPVGSWWFAYGGPSETGQIFVAAGGSSIRETKNFGETWLNKEGNLTSVAPLPNINLVKVVL